MKDDDEGSGEGGDDCSGEGVLKVLLRCDEGVFKLFEGF